MKHVLLGSPPFALPVLARLLESPFRPALVVTPRPERRGRGRKQADSPLSELAQASGTACFEVESVREPAVLERLRAEHADVFLVVSYGEFLREEFLGLPKSACLNVHPSLLPRWRGATPIQAAIRAGDEETGTTIQRVVLALDAGDILVQERTRILPGETAGELAARLAELSGHAALEALQKIERGGARWTPQDPERVTVCRKLAKEDGRIDWSLPALELERHVRAMNPWPLAHTTLADGQQLGVWRAALARADVPSTTSTPGTILEAGPRLVVATGEGALALEQVQVQGKRVLPAADFLRGARLAPGERLG